MNFDFKLKPQINWSNVFGHFPISIGFGNANVGNVRFHLETSIPIKSLNLARRRGTEQAPNTQANHNNPKPRPTFSTTIEQNIHVQFCKHSD
ncbi:hypothetical protein T11_12023 [Trichinella zimbabwensis]|uniref:Uncharacterized protein n=1 Tax=Trichinella zimbabwensis TaxID=268475 RepID=A0A0V1I7N4_9BILA|nr:hypothetical protein T11_12023 [Trichinella zimbabwensis]